ncbi:MULTISPECIES: hypothetical protein [unclassified Streptomyces]|uniref:hypothetical protein n=1 Tax=unclassified Streptomyces TaxID=2593676 RepID=UPI002259DA3F|nr:MULTISPECIES: hypothetical protein [unclassified Streptomyces]MCX5100578.1 hypothetical protein [Streptomyces sp. NBC_00439]WSP52281.1 hypothetical protein OG348_26950 [Streptomyces sp. NBC_01243]
MRPVRLVTGTAASALTIATLGFLTACPAAYADEAGAQRISSADPASRATDGLASRATGDEASGDGASGDESGSGSGADTPFSLDNLSNLIAPSLLDSAGGITAPGGDEGTNRSEDPGRGEKTDPGEGTDRGEKTDQGEGTDRGEKTDQGEGTDLGDSSSSGRENSSSSGHDSSGGRESRSPSEEGGSGKQDGSSSGNRPEGPDGPTGHVKTGVGGSVRPDTTQIAAGAGVLAATAVGGAWLLRRRASGTQGAG